MDGDDKIIHLDFGQKKNSTFSVERRGRCPHTHVGLDDKEHVAYCQDCGVNLDAVKILIDLANGDRNRSKILETWEAYKQEKAKMDEKRRKYYAQRREAEKKKQQTQKQVLQDNLLDDLEARQAAYRYVNESPLNDEDAEWKKFLRSKMRMGERES